MNFGLLQPTNGELDFYLGSQGYSTEIGTQEIKECKLRRGVNGRRRPRSDGDIPASLWRRASVPDELLLGQLSVCL